MKTFLHNWIRRNDEQGLLMGRMVARLGLDPMQAYDRSMGIAHQGTLAARCFSCRNADACRRWLDGEAGLDRHSFCANADAFDRLRA